MLALTELKVLLDCDTGQWEYKVDKTSIQVEPYHQFQRKTKEAKVYALVEVNHLLRSRSADLLGNTLPDCLGDYLNVFSSSNTKKLALYRNIDLAIKL